MTILALVVAVSRNGIIGRDGGLPWRISSDLKLFKSTTLGKPVIMGRKTWESLPRKPLPGRRNIVLTSAQDFREEGAEVAHTPDAALALANAGAPPEICVIGGGSVYETFLPLANRIYLSEVDLEAEGDTRFALPDARQWREVSAEHHLAAEGDTAGFTFRILERRAA